MFKKKCHKFGEAIQVINECVVLCRCISAKEAGSLYELGWKIATRMKENK